ncbi:hypothetical protein ACFOWM_12190 [Ferruginibacter yonginensis]|uniref:Uncharacterized protein n=1 Tax=Ferruginibacter yonginensis TaxID=1310416 RepID=A0ABV8QTQ8_9BACT
MKKIFFFAFALFVSNFINAQIGIGNNDPKATLDVNKLSYAVGEKAGIAVTQQTGLQIVSMNTNGLKAGTLVYATSIHDFITSTGFWNWNGTTWVKTSATPETFYNADGTLTGNRNVTQASYDLTFTGTGKFIVNANTLIGSESTTSNAKLNVVNQTATGITVDVDNYGSGNGSGSTLRVRGARGSITKPIAQAAGEILGSFRFSGHDGTAFLGSSAAVAAVAEESFSSTANGTSLAFYTVKKGATSNNAANFSEKMRIGSEGNVGIGTSTPNATAILDINSTNKGILFPRITTAQMIAIIAPATGLQIYNSTTNSIWVYNGTNWLENANKTDKSKWQFVGSKTILSTLSDGVTARTVGKEFIIADNGRIGIGTPEPKTTLDVGGTAAMKVPVGTSAERPVTPEVGMIRYNGTLQKYEGYNGSTWVIFN